MRVIVGEPFSTQIRKDIRFQTVGGKESVDAPQPLAAIANRKVPLRTHPTEVILATKLDVNPRSKKMHAPSYLDPKYEMMISRATAQGCPGVRHADGRVAP